MSLEFYQTVGGRQFIDGTMKKVAASLEDISDSLKLIVDVIETMRDEKQQEPEPGTKAYDKALLQSFGDCSEALKDDEDMGDDEYIKKMTPKEFMEAVDAKLTRPPFDPLTAKVKENE